MDNNFYKILQTFKQLNEATLTPTPIAPNLEEGALDELYGELGDKYDELAPGIEKYKDEAGAERLYDELEAIAKQHGLISQFRNICNGARNSAHQEYDTNPGHFKNWFWFLPFENDLHEEPKFGGYLKGTDPAPKAGDNKAFGSCEEDSVQPIKHQIIVTISDPDSPAVSQRQETRQRKCNVTASDREGAVNAALLYYKKQGYKVHDHHYVGPVDAVAEDGMTTGGMTGMTGGNMSMAQGSDPVEKAKADKELSAIKNLVSAGQAQGAIPKIASQQTTAQTIQANPADLTKATPQQKKVEFGLGDEFTDAIKQGAQTTSGQAKVKQMFNLAKQINLNPGA